MTTLAFTDTGHGPPIVLLHAFPLSRDMWLPQVDGLHDAYRLITPDLPGFGGSPPLDQPSVDAFADAVAETLDKLPIRGPVVLGGLSMGGYVALAFARRHPARLRALILADTRAEPDDEAARANRDKTIAQVQAEGVGPVVEGLLPKLLCARTMEEQPEVVESVRRIALAQSAAGVAGALVGLRDRPDATAVLEQLQVPVLIVVGRDDALTPPARSEAMAKAVRRGQAGETVLEIIDGAGHLSNLENPEAFNAALRRFLDDLG
jgi:pimeloyl-ACP methyl ester carboxylesterase